VVFDGVILTDHGKVLPLLRYSPRVSDGIGESAITFAVTLRMVQLPRDEARLHLLFPSRSGMWFHGLWQHATLTRLTKS